MSTPSAEPAVTRQERSAESQRAAPAVNLMQKVAEDVTVESCLLKAAIGGVMGTGLGLAFGLFFSSYEHLEFPKEATTKQKIVQSIRFAGSNSWSWGKNFGIVGGLYTLCECAIEKYRGRTDIYNHVAAGCFTGAALSSRAGPQAMGIGCAGFAAFSVAMEKVMEHKD